MESGPVAYLRRQQVAAFACSLAARVGLSEGPRTGLRLAADEINIGLHANHGRAGWSSSAASTRTVSWLSITDEAPAFSSDRARPGTRLQAGPDHGARGRADSGRAPRGLDDFRVRPQRWPEPEHSSSTAQVGGLNPPRAPRRTETS